MRMRSPASRDSFGLRFSVFDLIWAAVSPAAALLFRDVPMFTPEHIQASLFYCIISFGFALFAFLLFRIRDGMADYFSVHDAFDVAKAVFVAELLTVLVLFSVTRLEGVPRSTPIVHALILAAGLLFARTLVRVLKSERKEIVSPISAETEHIIMIGSTKLTSLYMELIEAYSPQTRRVIAILDDNPQLIGRSVGRTRVMGPTLHLEPIIHEFADHGIRPDRIIVGGDPTMLSIEQLDQLDRICMEYEIPLDFVPKLVGFGTLQIEQSAVPEKIAQEPTRYSVARYFHVKRIIDLIVSLVLIISLLPIFLIVAGLVLLDVGSPIFFWQHRVGLNGQIFLLHKFRTLKTSFDWQGRPIPETKRLSWIGSLLRKLRLDELPQLLNVLVGDMSLIGPRPLLPRDQPFDPEMRLMVHPGITGWAQINGGKLLTAAEKKELDEWYIQNASLGLDLKIFAKTVAFIIQGAWRRESEPLNDAPRAKAEVRGQEASSEP